MVRSIKYYTNSFEIKYYRIFFYYANSNLVEFENYILEETWFDDGVSVSLLRIATVNFLFIYLSLTKISSLL